jgi:hypothetical protein
MFARVLKLGLAVVLLSTLAAPPAGAQGDDIPAWPLILLPILVVAFFFGVSTLAAIGLDRAIPDPPVALAEEHVKINLAPDGVRVSAECVFQNNADKDKTLELSYPFGKGRGVGPAEDVAVTDGAGREMPFTRKKGNVKFAVAVPAKTRLEVVIDYRQPVSGTIFSYLLGKDRFWGRGGAYTTFLVTSPAAAGKVDSVYRLDKVAEEDGCTSYVYVRDKFYPTKNFTITWKKPPPAKP